MVSALRDITDAFELLEEWEDRYRYLIELGRTLEPLTSQEKTDENKVQGCASQVWLQVELLKNQAGVKIFHIRGDSDAHIVRGLVAVILAIFNGKTPQDILATDASAVLERLGLSSHLTPQRSNGVYAMIERIRKHAIAQQTLGAREVSLET